MTHLGVNHGVEQPMVPSMMRRECKAVCFSQVAAAVFVDGPMSAASG